MASCLPSRRDACAACCASLVIGPAELFALARTAAVENSGRTVKSGAGEHRRRAFLHEQREGQVHSSITARAARRRCARSPRRRRARCPAGPAEFLLEHVVLGHAGVKVILPPGSDRRQIGRPVLPRRRHVVHRRASVLASTRQLQVDFRFRKHVKPLVRCETKPRILAGNRQRDADHVTVSARSSNFAESSTRCRPKSSCGCMSYQAGLDAILPVLRPSRDTPRQRRNRAAVAPNTPMNARVRLLQRARQNCSSRSSNRVLKRGERFPRCTGVDHRRRRPREPASSAG